LHIPPQRITSKIKKHCLPHWRLIFLATQKVTIPANVDENVDNLRYLTHHFAKTIFNFGIKYPNSYRLLLRHDCIDYGNDQLVEVMEEIYQLLRAILEEYARRKNIDVYFCDPQSPWKRESNESTNRLLRQHFPKEIDLSVHTQTQLNKAARQLSERP